MRKPGRQEKVNHRNCSTMSLRPYQVLCLICSFGEDDAGPKDGRLNEILDAVRERPDRPVALCCNAGDVYAYQDPGLAEDTPESAEFNRKRDMDILEKLDLAPGSILPARTVLRSTLKSIPTCAGICGYETVTSDAWRGCPKAKNGYYEKGVAKGIDAIIPPRSASEMARDKEASLKDMYAADVIAIRPHILLCAVAQYGGGTRPPFEPDNLPEMIQHFIRRPDTLVTLVREADWMMCAPCPSRVSELNACVCGQIGSGGLYNELKDLNVLQALGLTYGATMEAKDMYSLIFERIPSVDGICALTNGLPDTSVWRDGCGAKAEPCPNYAKGRDELMGLLR